MKALDLFAGAGGWDVAALQLGWDVDGVEIMPEAVATRDAAGLKTRWNDVLDVVTFEGEYDVHIASPPCQSYSMAGSGSGRRALDVIRAAIAMFRAGRAPSFESIAKLSADSRGALVLEPLRVALTGRPRFIAWEQVPTVLPVWELCADALRDHGYTVVTGILNSEQYGVPQTRRRAILVASRDGEARFPVPTHSRFHSRSPERLDAGVKPWVSMAEALGWGLPRRPAPTVCGGGTDTGGAEPFGNASRQAIRTAIDEGRWVVRTYDRPATTVQDDPRIGALGHKDIAGGEPRFGSNSIRVTPEEAAILQSFPAGYPFQGKKGKQYQQIDNAIPPLLALAILEAL